MATANQSLDSRGFQRMQREFNNKKLGPRKPYAQIKNISLYMESEQPSEKIRDYLK